MALYAMIVLRWTPAEAIHPISELELRPFRDAGYARADFHLSLQDCLFGIKKAVDLRLLKLDEFDVREYETYEKVENGDWNVSFFLFLSLGRAKPGPRRSPVSGRNKQLMALRECRSSSHLISWLLPHPSSLGTAPPRQKPCRPAELPLRQHLPTSSPYPRPSASSSNNSKPRTSKPSSD